MLNYEFPPLGGGAANATFYLLKEFAENNDIEIDMITSSGDEYKEEQFASNIRIYYLDIGKSENIHYQSNRDLLTYARKAHKKARELKGQKNYDLIHAFFGIPCGYIAMKLGLPYIVSLRGSDVPFYSKRFYWLDKFLFKHLSKKIWKKAKAVIANSEGLKNLALKSVPDQKIDVIHNGVDVKNFQKINENLKLKNEKFTVLFVGRLIERKGVKYLIDAFAKLNALKDCQLLIAGGGDQEKELKDQVERTSQTDSVHFLGALPHSDLPKIYRQGDVYVLPSFNEGMSNTLLEAMASGLPIVVTDTGGTRELVKGNGIIIEKGNADSIFDALFELKLDPEKRHKFGETSLKLAKEMSWAKAADKYMCYY